MPKSKLFIVPREPARRQRFPNNLPGQPMPLIGREAEVEIAGGALHEPEVRLLTLVGPGGVGKTRLALELAEELLEEFEDGLYFVELAPITDPELVIPTIASTLHVREVPGSPLIITLKEHLKDKRILLILDNFEQVIPAGVMVAELLVACPDLKLLVTSRSPLRLRIEREFAVSPLALPEPKQHPGTAKLSGYGAVALFAQRAGAVSSDFELTDDNANAVVEICRRVDGLPLAIELVAAHARLLSPQSILARLTHPLQLLTDGAPEAPARHKTMRDTIEWSYNLLSKKEQKLFGCLSVFVGGFSLRAAEAVCNEAGNIAIEVDDPQAIEVLKGIKALVEKNLVQQTDKKEDGDRRLTMLEMVREYAQEQLAGRGEAEAIQWRHSKHFLRMAEQIGPGIEGEEFGAWMDPLDRDQANLRAALNRLLEREETEAAEDALRLIKYLYPFWQRRTQMWELEKFLERALAQEGLGVTEVRLFALRRAGYLAVRQGAYERAKPWVEQALVLAKEVGDKAQIADAYNNLGAVAILQGDYKSGRDKFEAGLAIRCELGDEGGVGQILNNLGELARYQGDYKQAVSFYRESLEIFRAIGDRTGDRTGVLFATVNLGHASYHLGNLQEAKAAFMESLAISHQIESPVVIAESLKGLGGVLLAEASAESDRPARSAALRQVARLYGLAAGLLESVGSKLDLSDQVEFDRNIAAARTLLGEKAFTAAWEEGRDMTFDQALELATRKPDEESRGLQPRRRGRPRMQAAGGLSRREEEVAVLIGEGKSNREIADRLVVSERTIEGHVSNILSKLGFRSRAQVSGWVVEQNLTKSAQ